MAKLVDVLDRLGVKWQPTRISITESGKTPKYVKGTLAKSTDFVAGKTEVGDEELARRKELLPDGTHLAIDTRTIAQMDVDCATALEHDIVKRLMETTPYFLSCSKKLPHLLFEITGDRPRGTTYGIGAIGRKDGKQWRVEVLCGKWSWADKDATVENADLIPVKVIREEFDRWVAAPRGNSTSAPCTASARDMSARTAATLESLDANAVARKLKRSELPTLTLDIKRRVERYCTTYSVERATTYATWTRVIWGVLNIAYTHHDPMEPKNMPLPHSRVLKWARDQAHVFSRIAGDVYDAGSVDKLCDEFTLRSVTEDRVTMGSLQMWNETDRGERDESECESDEAPPPKKKACIDPFDAALSLLRELEGRLALCGEELMWFNGRMWKTFTEKDLELYATKNAARRGAYMRVSLKHVLLASQSDDALAIIPGNMRSTLFREVVAERSVGKLTFLNGTLDFKTKRLEPTTPENAGLCAVGAEFDHAEGRGDDRIASIFADAFPDAEPRKVFLHILARALAGHVEDKHLGMLIGLSGNSKTTIINFICRAFSGACAHFTGAHLANRSAVDPERSNAWLAPLEGLRVAFSDELTTPWLNGNRLRTVVPGDYATSRLRRLYEEGKEVLLTAQLFFCLNAFPDIHPLDDGVRNRLVGFQMKTTFVDAGDERLNEGSPYVKLRDKGLPKELRSDEALHTALFRHIVKAYSDPPSGDETTSVVGWTHACLKIMTNNADRGNSRCACGTSRSYGDLCFRCYRAANPNDAVAASRFKTEALVVRTIHRLKEQYEHIRVANVTADQGGPHLGRMRTDVRIRFENGTVHTGEVDGDGHFVDGFLGTDAKAADVRRRDVMKAVADHTIGVQLQWRIHQRDAWGGIAHNGCVIFNWVGALLRLLTEPLRFSAYDVVFIERTGNTEYDVHKRDMVAAGLRVGSLDPKREGIDVANVRDLVWEVLDHDQGTLDEWLNK